MMSLVRPPFHLLAKDYLLTSEKDKSILQHFNIKNKRSKCEFFYKKITDNFLSAIMAPLVGLEPTTYRLLHYTYFHKHYINIICSLDFIFTISFDLGRWCKVSTHNFRLARYYRVFLLTNSTDLATFSSISFLIELLTS